MSKPEGSAISRFLLGSLGVLLAGFGAFMTAGGLLLLFDEQDSSMTTGEKLVLVFVLGLAPLAVGITIFRRLKKQAEAARSIQLESSIIRLARNYGGKLTAAELAEHTHLSLDQAGSVLKQMHIDGMIELQVSDSGTFVFEFPLITQSQKDSAEDV